MEREKGRIHSSKTNRWARVINTFLLLSPSLVVFCPTIPCCQNICDLYHTASKEEFVRQPKSQQDMEVTSHLVLVSLVKSSQHPLIARTLAQLPYMVQITPSEGMKLSGSICQLTRQWIAMPFPPSAAEPVNGC